jgi:hypothetical protein
MKASKASMIPFLSESKVENSWEREESSSNSGKRAMKGAD